MGDWKKDIENLNVKGKANKEDLKKAIVNAVVSIMPKKQFGILFSGGVDSTLIALIAKQHKADFICYAVGLKDSPDIVAAKRAAKLMGLKLKYKEYSLEEVEKLTKKAAKLLGDIERPVVHVGVAAVELAAIELAKKDKINLLFGGLGSEEIFAGYDRHKVKNINKECWFGLMRMDEGDLVRDDKVAEHSKIKFLAPFLDDELIKTAMQIPGKEKINEDYKKVILRKVAEDMGMPKEIAWRKKKAAQYGSGFDRAIKKISKKRGFEYKKEYLRSLGCEEPKQIKT